MDDGCFTRKSLSTNDLRSCTTCIVYVTLSKISISFGIPHLAESGCKGKEFQTYLPNFFGSFFHSFSQHDFNALLRKGSTPERTPTGTRTSNTDASFSKAGAKVRTLKHILQIFPKFFSKFFFQSPKAWKTWKNTATPVNRNCQTKCHITKLPFPKAGAKLDIRLLTRKH